MLVGIDSSGLICLERYISNFKFKLLLFTLLSNKSINGRQFELLIQVHTHDKLLDHISVTNSL